MSCAVEQKLINKGYSNGESYNFLRSPGSIGSLQRYLDDGWIVKFIEIIFAATQNEHITCLLERNIEQALKEVGVNGC